MPDARLSVASADASFRRYFRVHTAQQSYILMDAPPDKENSSLFVTIAQALSRLDVHAPTIYAADLELGFLLLEDLGDRTYLDELKDEPNKLYSDALAALVKLQHGEINSTNNTIETYDKNRLQSEMDLFEDWFIKRHLGLNLQPAQVATLGRIQRYLIDTCLTQPQVWVHRDFHSRNLMITDRNSPGVIDFQDLVVGPLAYDLASIFKDCYIAWPRSRQLTWLREYQQLANDMLDLPQFSFDELVRWYDLTGLQRHLKVLGIFCRLNYRDNKPNYLNDLPMVANYVIEVIDLYPELQEFGLHFRPMIESATA
ncbi:hypothetical protein DFR28_102330 [Arenicella xantha]|uniref:Aminoglycoside phosphotransferase domain-containing protein n=2 Tax=Arenicella xantha TaxID=644221 RepID=A0A395JMU0_9GAMM|nr:hypothetical protein DFR28_102330 [Arenicella xantha]